MKKGVLSLSRVLLRPFRSSRMIKAKHNNNNVAYDGVRRISLSVSCQETQRRLFSSYSPTESSQSSQNKGYGDSDESPDHGPEREDDLHSVVYTAFTFLMLTYAFDEFYSVTTCVGPSMLPTFREDGDVVIVQKMDHTKSFLGRLLFAGDETDDNRRRVFEKGDAVISHCKDDLEKTVCKRVAGLEGDLAIYRGNGLIPRTVRVPKGHVWLLGDNPMNSKDSRTYGPVPLGLIQGKILCKINIPSGFFATDRKIVEWVEHNYPIHRKEKGKKGRNLSKRYKDYAASAAATTTTTANSTTESSATTTITDTGSDNRKKWLSERQEKFGRGGVGVSTEGVSGGCGRGGGCSDSDSDRDSDGTDLGGDNNVTGCDSGAASAGSGDSSRFGSKKG